MSKARFNRTNLLKLLDCRAKRIAEEQKFNRSYGTAQLRTSRSYEHDALIARAVEYGRMRAMEEIACAAEEGFRFDLHDIKEPT